MDADFWERICPLHLSRLFLRSELTNLTENILSEIEWYKNLQFHILLYFLTFLSQKKGCLFDTSVYLYEYVREKLKGKSETEGHNQLRVRKATVRDEISSRSMQGCPPA